MKNSDKLSQIVLQNLSSGELALELNRRLQVGVAMRITHKGVRVTHSQYLDRLCSASAIDDALLANRWNTHDSEQRQAA